MSKYLFISVKFVAHVTSNEIRVRVYYRWKNFISKYLTILLILCYSHVFFNEMIVYICHLKTNASHQLSRIKVKYVNSQWPRDEYNAFLLKITINYSDFFNNSCCSIYSCSLVNLKQNTLYVWFLSQHKQILLESKTYLFDPPTPSTPTQIIGYLNVHSFYFFIRFRMGASIVECPSRKNRNL